MWLCFRKVLTLWLGCYQNEEWGMRNEEWGFWRKLTLKCLMWTGLCRFNVLTNLPCEHLHHILRIECKNLLADTAIKFSSLRLSFFQVAKLLALSTFVQNYEVHLWVYLSQPEVEQTDPSQYFAISRTQRVVCTWSADCARKQIDTQSSLLRLRTSTR